METLNFTNIRKSGLLLYEHIRGSHMYNLATATSDIDTLGVYAAPIEYVLGINPTKFNQIQDKKHDNVWYEIGRFLQFIGGSVPTVMESLFCPKDCIIGEVHPLMQEILDLKEEFLSKDMFKHLMGYAKQQIEKARGLNKMIVQPLIERKGPLDFCYTFYKQGSININKWLEQYSLPQKYCGLVNIPNMKDVYGLYYDWGGFFTYESITDIKDYINNINPSLKDLPPFNQVDFDMDSWANELKVQGFSGIVNDDGSSTSVRYIQTETVEHNSIMLNSVPKNTKPICYMTYNQDGYASHCVRYRRYKEWEENRNPIRYKSNLEKNYDAKNMSHCVRLIHMAIELANGEGFNVRRTWDRDFLLKIKNHGFEYDELMEYANSKYDEFQRVSLTSNLREHVDYDFVNDLLVSIRKKIFNIS